MLDDGPGRALSSAPIKNARLPYIEFGTARKGLRCRRMLRVYRSTQRFMKKVAAQRGAPLMDWSKVRASEQATPAIRKRDRAFLALNDLPEMERIQASRAARYRTRRKRP